jgi:hypothetical protein
MFLRISYLRRLTSCLAILISLMGNLQQSHALCYLTECDTASDSEECGECRAEKTCPHSHEHEQIPAVGSLSCGSEVADHHSTPCQDRCWCCSPAEPVSVPKDGSSHAQELLAYTVLASADYLTSVPIEHLVASFDHSAFRELDTLSAAQFCVQLCRFRI